MTRSEREAHIQRYLSGAMTSAEEQDFFIQVAVDDDLRLELKAQRTVESAMRKERDALFTSHAGLRERVATSLAMAGHGGYTSSLGHTAASATVGATRSLTGIGVRYLMIALLAVVSSGVASIALRSAVGSSAIPSGQVSPDPRGILHQSPQRPVRNPAPSSGEEPATSPASRGADAVDLTTPVRIDGATQPHASDASNAIESNPSSTAIDRATDHAIHPGTPSVATPPTHAEPNAATDVDHTDAVSDTATSARDRMRTQSHHLGIRLHIDETTAP